MHILLVTGPGGAGRTTVAAATALGAARAGRRVLLLSGDPGDPLAALLHDPAAPLGPAVPVAEGLTAAQAGPDGPWVARIDSGEEFRQELVALQERGTAVLGMLGARALGADELTELPGAEQFALLRALRRAAAADGFDLAVVDMPPAHHAVAALALPGQLRRYLARLLPAERQAARALRPVLAQLAGVPMPARWLYEAAARWDAELAAVQAVIESPTTRVRLVAEPGPAGYDALRLAGLGLALHQVPVESVVANRTVPAGSADPWLAGLAARQDKYLGQWPGARTLPHLGRDPRGRDDLALLDPGALADAPARRAAWPVEDRLAEDGVLVWRVPLPGAEKRDLDLVRRGDELLLTAGPYRRIVPLPSALRRCTVSGAALRDGELRIRFTPDPALWPRTP
ncbi:ArsA family ATPase [Streptomyces antimicrobicus]|uniref:ArsA family ATPase n=1 Tax=Streptomyces antimicrobicus TaxID=2883108 RepID=A0ABS8BA64_9ACTN|nr:ArsA-related P-loop ATPase [Streptomyces antimicrobicus]MCB5181404.1 ArsA family ATPase [Streptomyces antimicrobicus]